MPCSLAVSITKAAVNDEQLKALLTLSVMHQVIENFLKANATYKDQVSSNWQTDSYSVFYVGNCSVTIFNGGRISVDASQWSAREAETLSADITTLLARLADHLFAQQVQQALAGLGPVQAQTVAVDDQGVTRQATVLSLKF